MVECPARLGLFQAPEWLNSEEWQRHYGSEQWRDVLASGVANEAWQAEYEKPPQQASQSETRNLFMVSRRTYPAAWKYGVVAVPPEREVSLLKRATWNESVGDRFCRT